MSTTGATAVFIRPLPSAFGKRHHHGYLPRDYDHAVVSGFLHFLISSLSWGRSYQIRPATHPYNIGVTLREGACGVAAPIFDLAPLGSAELSVPPCMCEREISVMTEQPPVGVHQFDRPRVFRGALKEQVSNRNSADAPDLFT